jgi:UDP:flavonoid glycosyltransferase YjiC (YdhE family)
MNYYFAMSKIATYSQQSPMLEFPLTEINADWYYCGPLRNQHTTKYVLPAVPNDNRTNVYISFGSIQGSRYKMLKKTAMCCMKLGLRPIIAHAGRLNKRKIQKLEKYALVFDYIKQPDIFTICDFLISHCGLNTVLDALSFGRPILAMPFGIEQTAIATKVVRTGSGIRIKRFTNRKIRNAIIEIISNQSYRLNAEKVKDDIKQSGGAIRAANIILEKLQVL